MQARKEIAELRQHLDRIERGVKTINERADSLDMKIDLRRPHLTGGHLFYGWNEGLERLKTAAARLAL